jgi:hypothetical protein
VRFSVPPLFLCVSFLLYIHLSVGVRRSFASLSHIHIHALPLLFVYFFGVIDQYQLPASSGLPVSASTLPSVQLPFNFHLHTMHVVVLAEFFTLILLAHYSLVYLY